MVSSCATSFSESHRSHTESGATGVQQPKTPNPEHAWRTLVLMNEWIRHSDAKAGVTLALAGVLGTMVSNLSEEIREWTRFSASVVIITCFSLEPPLRFVV